MLTATVISLILVLRRASEPHLDAGATADEPGRDVPRGVVVVRLAELLFYGGARSVEDQLEGLALRTVARHYLDRGIELWLAGATRDVLATLERSGFVSQLGDGHVVPAVGDALEALR
ncbi:MAG: hypothetical protein U5R31_15970 [Acidimicrobiia bacterium]|nr:hypothetical protein [Acidimicrobiia bacterium]